MMHALTAGDVMSPCPVAVNPHHTLAEAHAIMRNHRVRHLPVQKDGRLVGVVSLGDLRLIESLEQLDTTTVEVEDAMTVEPYQVDRDEPLTEVLAHMISHKIGSALVVDEEAVIGIFTCIDALAVLGRLLRGEDARRRETT